MPATLSPMVGETLAQAAGGSVAGGPAAPKPTGKSATALGAGVADARRRGRGTGGGRRRGEQEAG
eukprot:4887975-Pleurochrysis_carterae.AAC.5